ncbi:hypothetical protein V8E53_000513 [Lactarius tabidus]
MLASSVAVLVLTASIIVPALSTPIPIHGISDVVSHRDASLLAARIPEPIEDFPIDQNFNPRGGKR